MAVEYNEGLNRFSIIKSPSYEKSYQIGFLERLIPTIYGLIAEGYVPVPEQSTRTSLTFKHPKYTRGYVIRSLVIEDETEEEED